MRSALHQYPVIGLLVAVFTTLMGLPSDAAEVRQSILAAEGFGTEEALLTRDREIYLVVRAAEARGWSDIAKRYADDDLSGRGLQQALGISTFRRSMVLQLPLDLIAPYWQHATLKALFPNDTLTGNGWLHEVTYSWPGGGETLYRLSIWFTGSGAHVDTIRQTNRLTSDTLETGQVLLIPRNILLPGLASPSTQHSGPNPSEETPTGDSTPTWQPLNSQRYPIEVPEHDLTFWDSLDLGEYAEYRLKPGESIYSAVVVKYTGLLLAEDVNDLAEQIARDSFIEDVADIPVNYPIRIRTEHLQSQYLYDGHPRKQALIAHEERVRAATESAAVRFNKGDLRGVGIIIDPGHGGTDPGANVGGVWEHEYCYDIAVRLKRYLESKTAARVEILLHNPTTKHTPQDTRRLSRDRTEFIRTTPPYKPLDTVRSLNLRAFLANYWSGLWNRGEKHFQSPVEQQVLFSIHADALHPSVRGSMMYYPDSRYMRSTFDRRHDSFYMSHQEVKQLGGRVTFTGAEHKRTEVASRRLGNLILQTLKERGIGVHHNQPLRGSIQRKTRFVPAIIRNTKPQTRLLVETVNLNNAEDRKLLTNPQFRQRYAEALAHSLIQYFE